MDDCGRAMVQWVDGSIPHGGPLSHSLLQQSAFSLGPTQKKTAYFEDFMKRSGIEGNMWFQSQNGCPLIRALFKRWPPFFKMATVFHGATTKYYTNNQFQLS